jgi:hypothetical protein
MPTFFTLGTAWKEKLEPLAVQLRGEHVDTGHVAPGPGKTGHDSRLDQAASSPERHNDRDRVRCLLRRLNGGRADGGDDVDLQTGQFGGQPGQPPKIVFGRTFFISDRLPLDVAQRAHGLSERARMLLDHRGGEPSDPIHSHRRLCLRDKRRSEKAACHLAEKGAPVDHGMISSARPTRGDRGMAGPRALAVLNARRPVTSPPALPRTLCPADRHATSHPTFPHSSRPRVGAGSGS